MADAEREIVVWVPPDLLVRIEAAAKSSGVTPQAYARHAIWDYLERNQGKTGVTPSNAWSERERGSNDRRGSSSALSINGNSSGNPAAHDP